MSINYQDINENDHFVISGCSLFLFSAWASSVDSQLKCRHAALYVSSCFGEPRRQSLILLIVSGTYSNKTAYTPCISPRLSFKRTLMSCFTFFSRGLIFGYDSRGFGALLSHVGSAALSNVWKALFKDKMTALPLHCHIWRKREIPESFVTFCCEWIHQWRKGMCSVILRFVKCVLQPKFAVMLFSTSY